MKKDWFFTVENNICDVRTAGVLIKDGKILVQRDAYGNEYALPGGHIKIGETLEEALVREYKEETGADIIIIKLLWSEECFWEWNGKNAHNFSFYYLIDLCEGSKIPDNGEFMSHKDNFNVLIGWMDMDNLKNAVIYPDFIKNEIYHTEDGIKHFVSDERKPVINEEFNKKR